MINDKSLFFKGSENLNMGEIMGPQKGRVYFNTAKKIFNQIIEESSNNQIISGSYINLCKIEHLLDLKFNKYSVDNMDICISEEIFNKCMEYIDKANYYNEKNSNLIAYRSNIYLARGKYNEAIQVLQSGTVKDIDIFYNMNYLSHEIYIMKLQREDMNKYINRDRIDFLERLYKIVVELNTTTIDEREIVFKVVSNIVSILTIAHHDLCNECPKRLLEFYSDVEKRFDMLLPNIISIVGSSCIGVYNMEYLEAFIKRCLENKYCVNSLTKPSVIIGYKSYLHTALLAQGKYDECREIDKESLKVIKNNTTLHNAGNTMFKLKDYEKAIKYLKQALFIYEDETTYKLLADCYFEYNKFEEAIKYYIKSLTFINEKYSTFTKKDGDMLVRSSSLGDSSKTKINLYECIINSYINLKDYSTALAYNTIATNEYMHEDSFRMMNKVLNNFVDMANENNLKTERLDSVKKELNKQQEFTKKALVKVSKWAEEIMNIQEIGLEDFMNDNEFEKLEDRLLEIANDMKSETKLANMTYTKLRRALLNEYRGIEKKSIDFLATGEFLYRANEGNMIDYAPIMLEFCKVVELELNAYIKKVFKVEGNYTLGTLNRNISKWGNTDLKNILEVVTEYRNSSAHSGIVDRAKVSYIRKLFFEEGLLKKLITIKKAKSLDSELAY